MDTLTKREKLALAVVMGIMALICVGALVWGWVSAGGDTAGTAMEYEAKLFDTSAPLTVDILMDEAAWEEMLANAADEVYRTCDVVINGETFRGVGIRPKGNTSLSSIAMNPDTDRFSFKLEFDHFVSGQTCWGLDKLALNNSFADATNMKEALVYDMYRFLEGDASLYNYAVLSVNGTYWGVYLALEAVEDSFMLRNYGVQNGDLYKPDSMNFGGRDDAAGESFRLPDFSEIEERIRASREMAEAVVVPDPMPPEGDLSPAMEAIVARREESEASASGEPSGGPGGGFPGPGGGSGANLNYINDDPDSYSAIWNSAKTEVTAADKRRVVTALRNVSEGTALEDSLFLDSILRYMAVHSFSVNGDSLSGSLPHNYYLYESGGRLSVIPWDYNLAFGTHGNYSASAVVNDPIDESWGSTHFFDAILENDEYRARYHAYYETLIDEYILGGGFQEAYDRIRSQIDGLVAADPNALYDYEEYDAAAEMLQDLILRRGESVRGQLAGTIPSTKAGQLAEPEALIDASDLSIGVMGSFMGGGRPSGSDEPSAEASGETGSPEPEESASGEASGEEASTARSSNRRSSSEMFAASREMMEASREMMEASREMAQAQRRETILRNALGYAGLFAGLIAVFLLLRHVTRRRK